MYQFRRSGSARRPMALVLLVIFLVSSQPATMSVLAAATSPDDVLIRAERLYKGHRYQEALVLVEELVAADDIEDISLCEAHALRARCLVQLNRNAEANQAFVAILEIDRDWQPAPGVFFTPAENELWQSARAGYDPGKPWWKKPLAWVAGVTVGVVTYVIITDDPPRPPDPLEELGDPPAPPQNLR